MRKAHKVIHIAIFILSLWLISNTIVVIVAFLEFDYYDFSQYWLMILFNPPVFLILLTLSSIFALLSWAIGNRAQKAGRSWAAFFWLSALVSPIIMGIIAVTLKPLNGAQSEATLTSSNPEPSMESKLSELQSLKAKGIISEEEFANAKKKTLGI